MRRKSVFHVVMMSNPTSLSLLQRVKNSGDSVAWSEFAGLYQRIIENWLRIQGIVGQDADDVQQEILTFVAREIHKFDHNGRPGAFRNWLRKVTSNRIREFWRARNRQITGCQDLGIVAEHLADEQSGVSRIWREEYDRFVIDHLLESVTDRFQENSVAAFRKVVLEQRAAAEVADELNMTLGAVRVAQSRVLRALRKLGEELLD